MRKTAIVLILLCFSFSGIAQEVYTSSGKAPGVKRKELERRKKKKEGGWDLSRMVVGGTLGFGMADKVLAFNIAPMVGYRVTDKLALGVGFGYQYFKQGDAIYLEDLHGNKSYYDFKANMISASVWGRYLILEKLFAHLEYEHNFFSFDDYRYSSSGNGTIETFKQRLNVPSVLVGAGYRQPLGENASIYIMGFYDVLQQDYSPYKGSIQPRIGFTIGF